MVRGAAQKIKARLVCRICSALGKPERIAASTLKALRTSTARAIAVVLAELRQETGLTQRQLAARVRRPHSVIGMIESEQRTVSVHELIVLAETMGMDPVDVFKRVLRERRAR